MPDRDYAKRFDRHQKVDGVLVCDCLKPDTQEFNLAVAVAKLAPAHPAPPVVIDVIEFDYGERWGVCLTARDGQRHAITLSKRATPAQIAGILFE